MTWTHNVNLPPLDPFVVGVFVFFWALGIVSMLHHIYVLYADVRTRQADSPENRAKVLCDYLQRLPVEQAVPLTDNLRINDPVMYILVTSILYQRLHKRRRP